MRATQFGFGDWLDCPATTAQTLNPPRARDSRACTQIPRRPKSLHSSRAAPIISPSDAAGRDALGTLQPFDDRVLIGEIYLPVERLVAYYGADLGGAHLPFNFSLLSAPWNAREIDRLIGATRERGLTLVPTRVYFSQGGSRAKLELALARGKDVYDKRQAIRKRETAREIARELREAQR